VKAGCFNLLSRKLVRLAFGCHDALPVGGYGHHLAVVFVPSEKFGEQGDGSRSR
jgi:hypothetical protein